MRLLVTGATGFLGGHLVTTALREGATVTALVRATSKTEALEARGVQCRVADLTTGEGLADALADVDALAHLAGGGMVRHPRDYDAQNAATTATLMAAVAEVSRPLRVVLASSVSALGPSPDGTPPTEPKPVSLYGKAKLRSESATLALPGRHHVTILRPPAIYGPGDTRFVPLVRQVARGRVPVVGKGGTTSLVFGPDCAEALWLALTGPQPSGRVYGIADGPPHTVEALGRAIADALGVEARLLRLPTVAVRLVGALSELQARARGKSVALTRDKARDMVQAHWVSDAAALRDEVGWAPRTSLAVGWRATVAAYREAGWLG